MNGQIIRVECLEYDPRQVAITIVGPTGEIYTVVVYRTQYQLLAMLPGFPPDPCA